MQINTLRAQDIHKEKYQPRKNACLISDQTRKTVTKDTTRTFVKIQRRHACSRHYKRSAFFSVCFSPRFVYPSP